MQFPLFKGPVEISQTNNHELSYRFNTWMQILSEIHGHHQMLSFFPCKALPGLYCNFLQFLLVLRAFCLQKCSICSIECKCHACSLGFSVGDWLSHCRTFHIFALKSLQVAFVVCFIVHPQCEAPSKKLWSIWENLSNSLLLIVDLNTDMSISQKVLIWWSVLKGFFLHRGKNYSWSVVSCDLQGLLVFLISF